MRNPSSPAGVRKIFQKGQQGRRSKCLVWHSPSSLPRVCERQRALAGSRVGCTNDWETPAVVGGCRGPWAWEHAPSHFGTPLHRRATCAAKVAQVLEVRDGIHNHVNYSHCSTIGNRQGCMFQGVRLCAAASPSRRLAAARAVCPRGRHGGGVAPFSPA